MLTLFDIDGCPCWVKSYNVKHLWHWTLFAVVARQSSSTEVSQMVSFMFSQNVRPVGIKCIMCLSLGLQHKNVWLTLCRCVTQVPQGLSKEINRPLQRRARGSIWTLSKWVSEIFQKTIFLVWNCHSSGHRPSKTENTAKIICFYNWYCGPQWCECTFMMNVLLIAKWWRHVGQCAISFHAVFRLTFQNGFQ